MNKAWPSVYQRHSSMPFPFPTLTALSSRLGYYSTRPRCLPSAGFSLTDQDLHIMVAAAAAHASLLV
ncbi:hypothetical protein VFPFJ_07858 [Purpureocillium lilacinum]|uniref:Uncharacterized protein n=1 Tax=Purpureocillium lilacinum TaxID=33203 RepID=A0A179H7R3_PURLI|nr:hypothetical protein VFPFJ_07858 [Purpureocillium lilacinum]OAQ85469.1 hypothetical protein VFPFJ_07858 [Purpureocillium lilacinum]